MTSQRSKMQRGAIAANDRESNNSVIQLHKQKLTYVNEAH
jgi:hypothetical protein